MTFFFFANELFQSYVSKMAKLTLMNLKIAKVKEFGFAYKYASY